MREIRGPDSLFALDVSMDNESSNEVLRVLDTSFPESVAIVDITEKDGHTNVTVFCRDRCLVTEVSELHNAGKVTCFKVR